MRGEKSVHDSRIGAKPFVHCETWDILVKIMTKKIWIMDEKQQQNQKTRAGPARNPGTPRPGARRHGKGTSSQTTTWSNLQLLDYIHSTASCRNMLQQIENGEILQTDACVKLYSGTLTDKRTWATQDDPRPALTLAFQSYIRRTSVQSRDVSSLPE